MKQFKVILTDKAIKELKKLDKPVSSLIIGWIEKNLEGCDNPRISRKSFSRR